MTEGRIHHLGAWLPAAACVLAAAASGLLLLGRYAVDVPYMDEWNFVPPLWHAAHAGTLDLELLFRQHNEHRLPVIALVYVTLTTTVGWSSIGAMLVTQACLLVGAIGCAVLARQTVSAAPSGYLPPLALALALLYTPAQAGTLLWGFTLQVVLPATSVVAGVLVARRRWPLLPTLLVSAALAAVATFSFATGLVCWAVLPPILWWTHREESRARPWLWGVWVVAFGLAAWVFFDAYQTARAHGGIVEDILARPAAAAAAPFILLGHPLAFDPTPGARPYAALVVGGALAAWAVFPAAYLVRHRTDAALIDRAAPWLTIGAYGLAALLFVGAGRLTWGLLGLFASRYVSLAVWVVIAVVMLTAVCVRHQRARRGSGARWAARAAAAGGAAVALLHILSVPAGLALARETRIERLKGKAALEHAPVTPPLDYLLHISWHLVQVHAEALRAEGLLPPAGARTRWLPGDARAAACRFGAVTGARVRGEDALALAGWAWLPDERRPADGVVVTARDRRRPFPTPLRFELVSGAPPPEVAARLATDSAIGWQVEVAASAPRSALQVWALDAAHDRAYPLCWERDAGAR